MHPRIPQQHTCNIQIQVLLPTNPSPLVARLGAAVESHTFSAPLWATLGGNAVTVLGGLALARRGMPDLDATRTHLVVKDGGTVGLDWVRPQLTH